MLDRGGFEQAAGAVGAAVVDDQHLAQAEAGLGGRLAGFRRKPLEQAGEPNFLVIGRNYDRNGGLPAGLYLHRENNSQLP